MRDDTRKNYHSIADFVWRMVGTIVSRLRDTTFARNDESTRHDERANRSDARITSRLTTHNMTHTTLDNSFFRFEEDFVEAGIRCIPMIVRFKLDTCGIKLSLSQWSRMTAEQRRYLAEAPCDEAEDVMRYRVDLTRLIARLTGGGPTFISVPVTPAWSSMDEIPESISQKLAESGDSISLEQWQSLTTLQRFALTKLSRPGHENKNFPRAMEEFGLVAKDGLRE